MTDRRRGAWAEGAAFPGFLRSLMASAVLGVTTLAHAQTGGAALAEALFRSARSLAAAGNYAEACPKFAESQRVDPKLGTLMNLALCHEKEGQTATAWAEYTQAAELAARAAQSEREQVARSSALRLEGRLAHLVLRRAAPEPVTVTLDGQAIGNASLGTPIPVDPGLHHVTAAAVGRRTFAADITVAAGPGEQTVVLPALVNDGAAPAVGPLLPLPGAAAPDSARDAPVGHRTLGIALLVGGGVALATGAVFGGLAFAKKSDAEAQCGASFCTAAGTSDKSQLSAFETVSTVAVVAGVASAAAGLYFVLRSGSRASASSSEWRTPTPSVAVSPWVGPGLGALVVTGAF